MSWRNLAHASGTRLLAVRDYLAQSEPVKAAIGATLGRPRSPAPPGQGYYDSNGNGGYNGQQQQQQQQQHSQQGERQTWGQWARQNIAKRRTTDSFSGPVVEQVNLFPGWAARKYLNANAKDGPQEFTVAMFVSGYARAIRPPEQATRSQRALMRLAKGYAALPKLILPELQIVEEPKALPQLPPLTPSTEKLLESAHLPPRPDEITPEDEQRLLHRLLDEDDSRDGSDDDQTVRSRTGSPEPSLPPPPPDEVPPAPLDGLGADEIRRLHVNLTTRLQAFWATPIANRLVRLSIYVTSPDSPAVTPASRADSADEKGAAGVAAEDEPLLTRDVVTDAQGSFAVHMLVPWERLCTHPKALHLAFGDRSAKHAILVDAELLPAPAAPKPPPRRSGTMMSTASAASYASVDSKTSVYQQPSPAHSAVSLGAPSPVPSRPETPFADPPPRVAAHLEIPLTFAPVRLISDVDDTVKSSEILAGARTVFRNVFVKHLDQVVIRTMSDWYQLLYSRGVRFHYVSNAPFELFPVLREFFHIAQLPPGSLKLKYYGGGRTLFSGLWEAAGERKRAGVVDVLDAFPDAQFFLVGDTGEQDMELYAALARERPAQILGVFVRDVSPAGVPRIGDPAPAPPKFVATGAEVRVFTDMWAEGSSDDEPPAVPPKTLAPNAPRAEQPGRAPGMTLPRTPQMQMRELQDELPAQSQAQAQYQPYVARSAGGYGYGGQPGVRIPERTVPGSYRSPEALTLAERRRDELQARVDRARQIIPRHIVFRVFREPSECVEAAQVLDRLEAEARAL